MFHAFYRNEIREKTLFQPPDTVVEFRANINILSSKSYCIPLAKINLVCNKNNNYTTSTKYFGRNKFKDALFTHDLIFREPNNHTTISNQLAIYLQQSDCLVRRPLSHTKKWEFINVIFAKKNPCTIAIITLQLQQDRKKDVLNHSPEHHSFSWKVEN